MAGQWWRRYDDSQNGYIGFGIGGVVLTVIGLANLLTTGPQTQYTEKAHKLTDIALEGGALFLIISVVWYWIAQYGDDKEVPNSYMSPEFKPIFKKPPAMYEVPEPNFLTRNLTSKTADVITVCLWILGAFSLYLGVDNLPSRSFGAQSGSFVISLVLVALGGCLIKAGYWLRSLFD